MLLGGFRRPKHQPPREFAGHLAASHLSGSRQDVRGGKLDLQREQVGKAKKAGKRAEISLMGSRLSFPSRVFFWLSLSLLMVLLHAHSRGR